MFDVTAFVSYLSTQGLTLAAQRDLVGECSPYLVLTILRDGEIVCAKPTFDTLCMVFFELTNNQWDQAKEKANKDKDRAFWSWYKASGFQATVKEK